MNHFTAGLVAGIIAIAPTASGPVAAAATATHSVAQVQGTSSQEQAVRKAKQYLRVTAFSRKGLVGQLKYEGFSTRDATRAVDALRVNWNKQAAKKAKQYLRVTAFSRKGLVAQLKYEGFTTKQANYGVRAVGL